MTMAVDPRLPVALRARTATLSLLAAATALAACSGAPAASSAPAKPAAAAASTTPANDTAFVAAEAVQVAGFALDTVRRAAWRESWQSPARLVLDPTNTQLLGSIVEGRVTRVLVQPGDRVQAGQILVTIHSHELTDARNMLAQARAGQAEANSTAELATSNAARSERLYTARAGSLAELERAKAALVAAQEGQRRAAAELSRASEMVHHLHAPGPTAAGVDPEDVLIRAPFAGVVVSRDAQPGAVVLPGASLVSVSRVGSVVLSMRLPEAALGAAAVGSEVSFTVPAFPDRRFSARVKRVSPMLDSLTRTAEVQAAVENRDGALRAEMTAFAEVFGSARDSATTVPLGAVQDYEGDTVVVAGTLRGGGMRLEAVRVRVGRRGSGRAEILAGIRPGALVVSQGAAVARAEVLRQRDARAGEAQP